MAEPKGIVLRNPMRELRYIGAILALAIAAIHLFHPSFGALRFVEYLRIGTVFNPLPPLFTVSSFLIVLGVLLVYHGLLVRWVYLGGIALTVTLLGGYGLWHTLLDHGAFWPHIEAHAHTDTNPLSLLWLHLQQDLIGMISKVLELLLLLVLTMLYLDRKRLVADGE